MNKTHEQIEAEIMALVRLQQADYRALQSRHRAEMEVMKERYDALFQPLVAMLLNARAQQEAA